MNRRAVDSDGGPAVDEKFSRRPLAAVTLLLMILAAVTVLAIAGPSTQVAATVPPTPAPPTTSAPEITRPPISANDFIPEDRDLTSCIGVLERPGCGSESRGGWRQTLVFGALFLGLVIVFGNVVRGVRRRDR